MSAAVAVSVLEAGQYRNRPSPNLFWQIQKPWVSCARSLMDLPLRQRKTKIVPSLGLLDSFERQT